MSTAKVLRLGTRGSRLALWQAHHVTGLIRQMTGAPGVELIEITTTGDRIQDMPLSAVSGQAFFTKEIEQALLDDRIDLAVHSMKDLATLMPEGLVVAAVPERADAHDALLSADGSDRDHLPEGAKVGTSSLRRRALLARRRPDLELAELRGNVPTRIDKLRAGQYDAIVLAAAGLRRLELDHHISALLPFEYFLPAVAQGALALQTRDNDDFARHWVGRLDHAPTHCAVTAERALLRRVEGGCQAPVGALATIDGEQIILRAVVASVDGCRSVVGELSGPVEKAAELGVELADQLLSDGGDKILAEIRAALAEAKSR